MLEDLAFLLLVTLPTKEQDQFELFLTLLLKHLKGERQDFLISMQTPSLPACLLLPILLTLAGDDTQQAPQPPMLRYVRLSRSSVGDTLLACENSWELFLQINTSGTMEAEGS